MTSLEHWENLSLPIDELKEFFKDNIPCHHDGNKLVIQANAKVFPTKLLELVRSYTQVNIYQTAGKFHFFFYDLSYDHIEESYNGSTKMYSLPTHPCLANAEFWTFLQLIADLRSDWDNQMSHYVTKMIIGKGDIDYERDTH